MGFQVDSETHSERSYHSDSEYIQDEGVAGLALVSTNSYDIFDSPNEGTGRCFMAKGPKVSHPEYVDFNSDEDDLLGDDDYLLTTLVMKTMMNLLLIMLIKIKRMMMIRR